MSPLPRLDLPEPPAAAISTYFTLRFHGLHRIKEDLETSPSLIPSKDQHLLSLMGYPASRIVIPMIHGRREEYRLGTASPANHVLQPLSSSGMVCPDRMKSSGARMSTTSWNQCEPWFIDLSEAIRVDRSGSSAWQRLNEASAALDSGMRALQTYFRKYGTDIEVEPFVSRIVGSLDKFGVLV